MIDHNMVVQHLFNEPDYDSFLNLYLPDLLDGMYGCTDIDAANYNPSPVYSDNSCTYSDVNEDGATDINDIILLLNMILSLEFDSSVDFNSDGNLDILDIIELINIILN